MFKYQAKKNVFDIEFDEGSDHESDELLGSGPEYETDSDGNTEADVTL